MPARRLPVVLFAGWTVFVWLTRVRNAVGDEDLGTGERAGTLLLAATFLVLAAVVLASLRERPVTLRRSTTVLAGWTVGVWVVRAVGIATADHSAGFIAVHLALAALSIGLAGWAWSAAGSRPVAAGR